MVIRLFSSEICPLQKIKNKNCAPVEMQQKLAGIAWFLVGLGRLNHHHVFANK
jgi:hypothetical protein